MTKQSKPKTVEVAPSDNQPTKPELEQELTPLDIPGRTVDQRMKNLARALFQPVKLRRVSRRGKRRRVGVRNATGVVTGEVLQWGIVYRGGWLLPPLPN